MSQAVELLESTTNRKLELGIIALSGAGVFLDGYDLFILSIALILLKPYFDLSAPQISALSSAALLGAVFGSVLFGNAADKLGRRKLFLLDLLFFVAFAVASAFSQNLFELVVFRFLLGVGIGADYPVSSSYVAEFVRADRRGRAIASVFAFQGLGVLCAIAVGLFFLPMGRGSLALDVTFWCSARGHSAYAENQIT